MIRFIAAIDSNKGIADEKGIPWDLPTDKAYYRAKVRFHKYLIGQGTYQELTEPLADTSMFIATSRAEKLRPGFTKVNDARKFLKTAKKDIWVGGGAGVFESTLDLANELYLTRIDQDFHCTKFFPEYKDKFELTWESEAQIENGTPFRFEVWKRKAG